MNSTCGQDGDVAAAKAELRRRLVAGRRAMSEADRAAAGRRLRDAVLGLPEIQMAGTIAAYCSIGSEPDTRGLLFALWKRGSYVLLPVLLPDGDLDWASYEGPDSLTAGPRGLLEPGPAEPRRGPGAIARADLVLVPALAADRRGNRLAKGGGSTQSVADTVVKDKFYGADSAAKICKGFEQACAAANIK